MQVTIKVPIKTSRIEDIKETAKQYRDSFNNVSKIGWETKTFNGVELHKLTYYSERQQTNLPSQLVCSARVKATEALKSAKTKLKKKGKAKCPKANKLTIRYDARSANIDLKNRKASIATVNGRVHVNFEIPEYYQNRIHWKVCSTDLVFGQKSRIYLHVVVEKQDEPFQFNGNIIGVDLGVNRPAVTSHCEFFGNRSWKNTEKKYFNLKRDLQAKGTKSAKAHLKKVGRKVNGFRKDCDHVLSRRIVDSVEKGTIIVLEDLTDIRKRIKARKKQRRRLHSWSFRRLQTFLDYKARMKGCSVEYVDPRYTSQKCFQCGYTSKANRKTTSWFICKKCGFQHNADLNAAKNISSNYLANRGKTAVSGLLSTSPS